MKREHWQVIAIFIAFFALVYVIEVWQLEIVKATLFGLSLMIIMVVALVGIASAVIGDSRRE
jgi:hypothetical protein